MNAATLPIIDQPATVVADYLDVVKLAIDDHPRSQQKWIGPSEVGLPCTRRLVHKLAGHDEPERDTAWLPTIGTAVHSWLEEAFKHSIYNRTDDGPRYLTETRVEVGDINGRPVRGSADLFDRASGWVIDHKIVGPHRIKKYKAAGPGEQYRTQAHLYCRGFAAAGYHVNGAIVAFLPRNGSLGGAYFWSEPYKESVAVEGLARATGLAQLIDAIGVEQTLNLYPPCSDEWCPWCPVRRPYGTATPTPTTTADLLSA